MSKFGLEQFCRELVSCRINCTIQNSRWQSGRCNEKVHLNHTQSKLPIIDQAKIENCTDQFLEEIELVLEPSEHHQIFFGSTTVLVVSLR
jgi:hypothetical protein